MPHNIVFGVSELQIGFHGTAFLTSQATFCTTFLRNKCYVSGSTTHLNSEVRLGKFMIMKTFAPTIFTSGKFYGVKITDTTFRLIRPPTVIGDSA